MDNTIPIIIGLIGLVSGLYGVYSIRKALAFVRVKYERVLRERDALATRVRHQRERLHAFEVAQARRAKAEDALVDVAWDIWECQTDDKGLKRDFAVAFEAYTGKPIGSLGPSAVVAPVAESAQVES